MIPFRVNRPSRAQRHCSALCGADLPDEQRGPSNNPNAQLIENYSFDTSGEKTLLVADRPIFAPVGSPLLVREGADPAAPPFAATVEYQPQPNTLVINPTLGIALLFAGENTLRTQTGAGFEGVKARNDDLVQPYVSQDSLDVDYAGNTGLFSFYDSEENLPIPVASMVPAGSWVSNTAGNKIKPVIATRIQPDNISVELTLGAEENNTIGLAPHSLRTPFAAAHSAQFNIPSQATDRIYPVE